MRNMIGAYYRLTKPGIIYGNAITAIAGFLLASHRHIDLTVFVAMLVGLSLVIGSACVFNNYLDRGIDKHMARTQRRALVIGSIKPGYALAYATVLGGVGFALLLTYTTYWASFAAFIGFAVYIIAYGIAKRKSVHGTLVGSIAGAVPPVVGYTAVTGRFDQAALLLFLLLAFWQMPHFYAIAIYRMRDYEAAGIPVLPLKKGICTAKLQMLVYVHAFILAALLLAIFGYTGIVYTLVVAFVGFMWLRLALAGLRTTQNDRWARAMFRYSLIALTSICVAIGFEALLP